MNGLNQSKAALVRYVPANNTLLLSLALDKLLIWICMFMEVRYCLRVDYLLLKDLALFALIPLNVSN
jgi:hypothetical protein